MAGTKPPSWKNVFDAAERTVGTRVNEFVKSENYAILVGLAARAQREVSTRSERVSRRVLHFANLPAGSDVNRLLAQIGNLEREVRELRNQLDDAATEPPVRLAPRAAGAARKPTTTTRPAASSRRKVANDGVARQSRNRARQDPA
jgi:hypothetical protein